MIGVKRGGMMKKEVGIEKQEEETVVKGLKIKNVKDGIEHLK